MIIVIPQIPFYNNFYFIPRFYVIIKLNRMERTNVISLRVYYNTVIISFLNFSMTFLFCSFPKLSLITQNSFSFSAITRT